MNPLTGLIIDIPDPNEIYKKGSMLELYYHRWTGEHRLLNIRNCTDLNCTDLYHLDAEVLSLAGACSSWRQIKVKVPFVYLCYSQSRILVNDRLYWTCQEFSRANTILVFDIFEETFSLMELPAHGRKALPSFDNSSSSEFGLVDIEGNLCFWVVYRDESCKENVMICVWAAVDGDEKWKNTHSLCFNDEWLWATYYQYNARFVLVCCFCVRETELLFLFNSRRDLMRNTRPDEKTLQYLFHWDLNSGKYWTEPLPAGLHVLKFSGIIHKETLVAAGHSVAPPP